MAIFSFLRKRRADDTKEERVASRGKRDAFSQLPSIARLPNPDPTLRKFASADGIGLYARVLQQFPFVAGYCAQWVEHVLVTDRAIKAATSDAAELQLIADAAATRARRAWSRVRNVEITLPKALWMRFFGFARAEKVLRFDPAINEWIEDLYDVPQEAWLFDDKGREYLKTSATPFGIEVDPGKFIHFQWGSADTKYGEGDLSKVYLALWKMQQIEEYGLQAVEDYSKLIVIAHIPRGYDPDDRKKFIAGVGAQYRYYVTAATDDAKPFIELPTMNVTANGTAGRQEYEVLRFYERWIQILLLGAPQTQDKALGTGKLEDTRKEIWDDKTPLGSTALDKQLTTGWLDPYCDRNLADIPVDLRPRFESDSATIASGLAGPQAQTYLEICMALAANRITSMAAEEGFASLGIPRPRAAAIAASILKERGTLNTAPAGPAAPASPKPVTDPDEEKEAA
jgi:hypothetical protein